MSTPNGIPSTEREELLGKLSQADAARQQLRRTGLPALSQVADGRAWRELLKHRALRAARTAGRAAAGPALGALGAAAAVAVAVVMARRGRRGRARRR